MTEKKIFELLQNIQRADTNEPLTFNDYSRLIPEHVDFISKSLANSIYDSLKENNSASNSKRMDYIQLVRRWCNRDDNHFCIDKDNYQFVFECCTPAKKVYHLDRILEELYGDFENLPPDSLSDRLKAYYDEEDLNMIEKQNRLDYIAEFDLKKLSDPNFITNKGNIKLDTIDNFLKNFSCDAPTQTEIKLMSTELRPSFKLARNDRIKVVYALLNLNNPSLNQPLLTSIIREISSEVTKSAEEIELANYLWKSKRIEDVNLDILDLFPVIYEKPIINLCKDLLTATDDIERFDVMEKFKRNRYELIEKLKNASDLRLKILNLVDELFILSRYNGNLLDVRLIFVS